MLESSLSPVMTESLKSAVDLVKQTAVPRSSLRALVLTCAFHTAPSPGGNLWSARRAWPAVMLSPKIEGYYSIERVEIFGGLLLEILEHRFEVQTTYLTHRLGVVRNPIISDPAARWRLIAQMGDLDLPIFAYEDRPQCMVCHRPVPTGSAHPGRVDIHVNCGHYIRTVLIPAAQAHKEQLAREADK